MTAQGLLSLCNVTTGKLDSNAAIEGGAYPFFTCAPQTLAINTYAFDTEAVLLAGNNASGIFPVKYYNGKFNAYQRTYVLESKDIDVLDNRFLFYALQLQLKLLQNLSTGAATKFLTLGIMKEIQVPTVSIVDQRRIVGILSSYDNLIAANQRRIQLLEESARLLYREWFVKLRFPGHETLPIVDGVPEGWSYERLEAAFMLQRGFDLPASQRVEGDVPVFASTGVTGFHNQAKVTGPGVVTGRSGTLGEVHFIHEDFWPLNTTLWVKEFKKATPTLAYFILSTLDLSIYNSGASVPTLDRKTVHAIEVMIPEACVQLQFERVVRPILDQIQAITLHSNKLREARDMLLPKLLSRQLDVSRITVPNDNDEWREDAA